LKVLLIFCCNPSGWAQKWQRQPTERLASTGIANKTPFLAQFLCKTSKFGPNVAKFEAFTDSSWLPCSFFVVSYQAEQKNGQGHQAVHW
jgi:hypothetical protein